MNKFSVSNTSTEKGPSGIDLANFQKVRIEKFKISESNAELGSGFSLKESQDIDVVELEVRDNYSQIEGAGIYIE